MGNKIKKILLTGSSGTISTRLFEKLLEKGYNVIGFDKRPNEWHSKLNRLTIKGNLLKTKDLNKLPNDFDLIIHFAANARVYNLVLKPNLALENIITTYNILNFCKESKVKNFIFASSREIYGNKKQLLSDERDVDIHLCESPYGASKIGDEALIYAFSKCYNIDYLVFRFSNVYGMYDNSDRFIPQIIRKMSKNQRVNMYGKNKILDFTYIDDCIKGVIEGIKKFSKIRNSTINIGSGRGEKLTKVAQIMKKHLNSKSRIIIKPNRVGEVVKYVADISKAKKMLKYEPKYFIEEGLNLTINWYQKYGNCH